MDYEARLQELVDRLGQRGARMTPQRMAILQALLREDHPTAEQIYQRVTRDFPMTSLVTVYRTMALLVEMGEALEIDSIDPVTHYDGFRPYQHPHLTCASCGRVVDSPSLDARLLADLGRRAGDWAVSQDANLVGLCPQCQAKAARCDAEGGGPEQ